VDLTLHRARLLAGVAGPAAFVGAWAVGSVVRKGYSPARDAISRLAEQGAPTAPLMTAGFVAYGTLVPVFATALPRGARAAVAVSGLGTLAVAALPVTPASGTLVDKAHAAAAATAYAANIAAPVLDAVPRGRLALVEGGLWSALIAACLGTSIVRRDRTGLFQRAGLTLFDTWAVRTARRELRR
jgi:hypothetical protein